MPLIRKATPPPRERRARIGGIELRKVTDAEKAAGYIGALNGEIPLGTDSTELRDRSKNNGRPFVERMTPGCFKRSLTEDKDQMGFAGHTDDPLCAFARSGENLTITTDDRAMSWRALIPDTQAGRDLMTLSEKKIIRGSSFEFKIEPNGETWEKRDGKDVRTITAARLYTVNPVADPAYPTSELTAERSLAERRGFYAAAEIYDPTLTDDCCYAMESLAGELEELGSAQEYLRSNPAGALAAYAAATVTDCAGEIQTLLDWLTANGSIPASADGIARAKQKLIEVREKAPATSLKLSVGSRETELRIFSR